MATAERLEKTTADLLRELRDLRFDLDRAEGDIEDIRDRMAEIENGLEDKDDAEPLRAIGACPDCGYLNCNMPHHEGSKP